MKQHERHEYQAGDKFTFFGLPTFPVDQPISLEAMHCTRQWCEGCFFWDWKQEYCRDDGGLFPCSGHQRQDMKFVYFVEEGKRGIKIMKKLIYIETSDDGTELYIGRDGDSIGLLICTDSKGEPFITPYDPNWLDNKFGKDVVEEARQVMDYIIRRSNGQVKLVHDGE